MNSIWNNNISLFIERFPRLAELINNNIEGFSQPDFWKISQAKDGNVIAEENSLRLHSAYAPVKESLNAIHAEENKLETAKSAVFLGFGLGYTPIELCKKYPELPLILIEPDINHFLAAIYYMDWTPVFKNPNLILAISSTPEQASVLINQYGVSESVFFNVKTQTAHAKEYFDVINALIERNLQKEKINNATLTKFGKLWNSNCKRNAILFNSMQGVIKYTDSCKDKPFVLLAAGPSLQKILPYLKKIKTKATIVCVDTALKACLNYQVEPDFIVLTDPQYWAYRHIAGLKSPTSTLITELAVYPAVYRFKCKKIIVCNSQVPMAKEYTNLYNQKGDLGAGGSVASVAWNFCALCGAKKIYTCGLDLAFPSKETHIKGSTFEESCHTKSSRLNTAQTQGMPLLFSGNAIQALNYNNAPVLTDQRMKMFAWWFESRLAECPEITTYTLSPEGLKIPGITPISIEDFLKIL
ncbi:MAG: motility associated factor glycosyltransferase family protein [Treponema sp.]|nr:motility associated factor glycosyltransferase family protein [Treponema sp.]